MRKEQLIGKAMNKAITGNKFQDKNIYEYLYASLSQPPIKIIDRCDSEDEMNYIVECPNCGEHIKYGEHIYMLSGHLYCDIGDCRKKLLEKNEYLRKKYGN